MYERDKHDPPIPRNLPPVAGNITWSRHLLKRIEEPMKQFESNQNVLAGKDAKRIIKMYNKVAKVSTFEASPISISNSFVPFFLAFRYAFEPSSYFFITSYYPYYLILSLSLSLSLSRPFSGRPLWHLSISGIRLGSSPSIRPKQDYKLLSSSDTLMMANYM